MVELRFYNYMHLQFFSYELDETQGLYTATVPQAIFRTEQRELMGNFKSFPVTIFYNNLPAGFFLIDFGNDAVELSGHKNAALIRSLSVNPKFQGKGIGKEAMLKVEHFVKKYFPQTTEIIITVNDLNKIARHVYEACGFTYNGKTKMGRSGLQKVMVKKI